MTQKPHDPAPESPDFVVDAREGARPRLHGPFVSAEDGDAVVTSLLSDGSDWLAWVVQAEAVDA